MIFENRIDAAQHLISGLEKFQGENVVVLAIPRGGVPLGYVIAKYFKWPLSILLTKKIGHPMNKEYAIGAVSLETVVLDPGNREVPDSYIKSETQNIRKLLQERYHRFLGNKPPINIKGKTVVIVDDGIATGYTMQASIEMLKNKGTNKIVVAVPVASPRIIGSFKNQVDELIVLETPDEFMGVGQFYVDFSEVTDDDVVKYLND
ncbi:MAG: phosphoribosyltransferase [Bacteroidetes bacterium]|nr:phosphoribosyltransferase [Bacteroidota bacterium]